MRHLALALSFAILSLCARAETLVIFCGDAFAPLSYLQDNKPAGLMPRILERASRLSGDTYELKLFPWMRAYVQAERGEGGIIGLSYTEQRAKEFDYSLPVYSNDIHIVTRADKAFSYQRLDDLKGKAVGGFLGESFGDEVDKAAASGLFKIERDTSAESRIQKLLAGRLDAAFISGGQLGFKSLMKFNAAAKEPKGKFVILPTPLTRDPLHLAFSKGMDKKAALKRFDKALATLQKTGELKKLIAETTP